MPLGQTPSFRSGAVASIEARSAPKDPLATDEVKLRANADSACVSARVQLRADVGLRRILLVHSVVSNRPRRAGSVRDSRLERTG